jgi:hypothetical protein
MTSLIHLSHKPQLDVQQTFECYLCWHNPLNPQNGLADLSVNGGGWRHLAACRTEKGAAKSAAL